MMYRIEIASAEVASALAEIIEDYGSRAFTMRTGCRYHGGRILEYRKDDEYFILQYLEVANIEWSF